MTRFNAMFKSRQALRSLAPIALSGLVVLCSSFAETESLAQTPSGLVRLAAPVPATALGNPYARDDGTSVRLALFDALTSLGRDTTLNPGLATSWRSIDANTWVFDLRDDVVFHNGVPFTADSVVAAIDYLKSPEAAVYYVARHVDTVNRVEALDPSTVVFTTHEPDPILPNRLASVSIVEPGAWQELGVDSFAQEPVGTGPFTLVDWGLAARDISLKAFDGAWRKSQSVRQVRISVLPDSTTRLQALLSNQVDIAVNLDPDSIPQMEEAGLNVLVLPAAHIVTMSLLNVGAVKDAMRDKRVRLALNYAVNKRVMAEQVLSGHVRVPSQAVTPEVFGYNPDLTPYDHDPERARRLLAEAGFGDGLELTFGVFSGQTPADSLLFQLMQQDLAAVGVDVTLRLLSFADLMRRIESNEWEGIDAYSSTLSSAWLGDASQAIERMSCSYRLAFFCDPSMTGLIERSEREMDRAKRLDLLREIMAKFHDLAPVILLVDYSSLTATLPRVQNYTARSNGIEFEKMTLSD